MLPKLLEVAVTDPDKGNCCLRPSIEHLCFLVMSLLELPLIISSGVAACDA